MAHTLAWQVTTPATCTEDGVESNVCSVCKAVESTRTVSKLGGAHVAGEWQVTTQPTCSAEGVREQYCKNCNVLLQTEAVAKAAHKYDNGNFTFKSSTDYSNPNGTWTYTCTVCKATKNESGTMARPGNSLYAFNRIATRQWYSGSYFTFNGNGSFSASVMVETAQKFYRDLFVLCEKFLDKTGDLDDDSKLGTIYTRYFTSSELEGKEFTNKDVGTFFYAMTEWFKSDMPYYYFFNNYKYSYGSSTSGSSKRFSYTVQYVAGYKTESWRTRAINGIDKMIEDYTGYYENLYPDERLRAKAIYDKTAALIKYQDGGASSNSLACAVTGTGVCEGYALTFEFLCRLNGIEAHMCYCTEHAWNVAKVKGYWYVFDATWGDTSTNMAKYFGTLKHVEKEPKTRWFFDPSITFGSPSQLKLSYS